ncbi:uncharacterized protein LOC114745211 isoform X2 [Neltuma alba]|uniref:uncharacterized protein LOC114745211 isoform X2 n=1 Tax=Neltuma alba TaxID=207710 RepID=UPI0010A4F128|nr:uncharacterized protein LOC114745211 isoform X2 [Prosopis alba]
MFLMTSSTARSMIQLTTLKIRWCDSVELIVAEEEGESRNEIAFNSLEVLELDSLSKLQMFCSSNYSMKLPLLEKLVIRRCPRMTSFSGRETSAPMLRKILTDEQEGIWCGEGDLTRTVSKMFQDMSASTSRALSYEEDGAESKANEIDNSGKQEMRKHTIPHTAVDPPSPALEAVTSSIKNEALQNQEMYDISVERPLVQSTKIALSTVVHDADGSQGLQIHPSENLLVQDTAFILNDNEETTGTHVTQESIDKPFVQATRTAWDITIIQEKEELHDSDINLSKNLFNQITTSIAADNSETVGTPEVYESKGRFTVHDAQNVASHSMVDGAGKSDGSEIVLGNNLSRGTTNSAITAENRAPNDRAPSQASEAPSSSTPPDVCNSFKELDISVQLLPYLEAGVKKHPQVLNWLTTKRRRVFASSFLSLFAEVTRILRTTRRMNLTEDDRNYVRQCCAELQGVGFDDRWISYVHRRIEECGDEEDLEMKVEEVEDQLESINKELASMEESLVLLRDRSSRLHGYICLSTLINALFIILFFIIIYVYQKKN